MSSEKHSEHHHLARVVLCSFLFTFMAARILVLLIMTRRIPDLFLHVGGNHVHHLNYGIFLLAIVGGLLLFVPQTPTRMNSFAIFYGVGLGLTFDEFGMWLHLGGSYWQRGSWDAVAVICGFLTLLAFTPKWSRFRSTNWMVTLLLAVSLFFFSMLLWKSFRYAGHVVMPRLLQIESNSPS